MDNQSSQSSNSVLYNTSYLIISNMDDEKQES